METQGWNQLHYQPLNVHLGNCPSMHQHLWLCCVCGSAGTFSLWCHPKFEDRCHSVVEFIERAIMHSKNGKFLYFLRSRVPGNHPPIASLLKVRAFILVDFL